MNNETKLFCFHVVKSTLKKSRFLFKLPAVNVSSSLGVRKSLLLQAEWWIHMSSNWNPCTNRAYNSYNAINNFIKPGMIIWAALSNLQRCILNTCRVSKAILKGSKNSNRNIEDSCVLYIARQSLILGA